jgi:hypothetical protein
LTFDNNRKQYYFIFEEQVLNYRNNYSLNFALIKNYG